jgi:predicted ATPase
MTIQSIEISGFRSIRQLHLPLDRLNVVVGANGCGKSNLYRALQLLHEAAHHRLSAALAREGGIQNTMWAGAQRPGPPRRLTLTATLDDYAYSLALGYPSPTSSLFALDPQVKEETLWLTAAGRRPSALLLDRKGSSAFLLDVEGARVAYPVQIAEEASIFGHLSEPHRYPEVSQVREILRNWRFYHAFEVGPGSPLRAPQVGIRSPVLDHDGANLAAAFQTIVEIGDRTLLQDILAEAFDGAHFRVEAQQGRMQVLMERRGILRPLQSAELSDGTLRFLCLAVALLSPRPPQFMAFNEPESSLHQDLLPALARLIATGSCHSQLWITTHSPFLAAEIARHRPTRCISLIQQDGATVLDTISPPGGHEA